jgi:hypothetical protein
MMIKEGAECVTARGLSRIAVPVSAGRLAEHLAECEGVMLFYVDRLRHSVVREEFIRRPESDSALGWIEEVMPDMLFVRRLTPGDHRHLTEHAIFAVPGIGESDARSAVDAYLRSC